MKAIPGRSIFEHSWLLVLCLGIVVGLTACSDQDPEIPDSYGVYIDQSGVWRPLSQNSAEAHAGNDLKLLVYNRQLAIAPGELKDIVQISARRHVDKIVEVIVPSRGGNPSGYTVRPADAFYTTVEKIPFKARPLYGRLDTLVMEIPGKTDGGELDVRVVGDHYYVRIENSRSRKPSLHAWYTTLDPSPATLGERSGSYSAEVYPSVLKGWGDERAYNGRVIVDTNYRYPGDLVEAVETERKRAEQALKEDDFEAMKSQLRKLLGLHEEFEGNYGQEVSQWVKARLVKLIESKDYASAIGLGDDADRWSLLDDQSKERLADWRKKLTEIEDAKFSKLSRCLDTSGTDGSKVGTFDGVFVTSAAEETGYPVYLFENQLVYTTPSGDVIKVWMGAITEIEFGDPASRFGDGLYSVHVSLPYETREGNFVETFKFPRAARRNEFFNALVAARKAWGDRWKENRIFQVPAGREYYGEAVPMFERITAKWTTTPAPDSGRLSFLESSGERYDDDASGEMAVWYERGISLRVKSGSPLVAEFDFEAFPFETPEPLAVVEEPTPTPEPAPLRNVENPRSAVTNDSKSSNSSRPKTAPKPAKPASSVFDNL